VVAVVRLVFQALMEGMAVLAVAVVKHRLKVGQVLLVKAMLVVTLLVTVLVAVAQVRLVMTEPIVVVSAAMAAMVCSGLQTAPITLAVAVVVLVHHNQPQI
jgi:hypothetical protein